MLIPRSNPWGLKLFLSVLRKTKLVVNQDVYEEIMEQNPPLSAISIFPDKNGIEKKKSEERLKQMKARRNKKFVNKENMYLNPSTSTSTPLEKPKDEIAQPQPQNVKSKSKEEKKEIEKEKEKEKEKLSKEILLAIENLEKFKTEKRTEGKKKYVVAAQIERMFQIECYDTILHHTIEMCQKGATEEDVKRWIVEIDSYIREKCVEAAEKWWEIETFSMKK